MTVAELLDLAADRIEWQGWYQPRGDTEGACPLIAIAAEAPDIAPGHRRPRRAMVSEAEAALVAELDVPPQAPDDTIIWWNDDQTDPWVVIDTMRAAARKLRGES